MSISRIKNLTINLMGRWRKRSEPSRGNDGGILVSLAIFSLIAISAGYFADILLNSSKVAARKNRNSIARVDHTSAVNTLLVAYRLAELHYISAIATDPTCSMASTFVTAMQSGSGCAAGFTPVTIFTPADGSPYGIDLNPVLTYGAGCQISNTSSTCAGVSPLVTLGIGAGNTAQLIDNDSYALNLLSISPGSHVVELSGQTTHPAGAVPQQESFGFELRSMLPNAAHFRPNGTVVQEQPDPLAPCQGTPWGLYKVYDTTLTPPCTPFVQQAGGTGLAFYQGRFFGFSPTNGQVLDLMMLGHGGVPSTYLVEQNGTLVGVTEFPRYSQLELTNVDDITVIRDQIYYVTGSGPSAQIGVLDPNHLDSTDLDESGNPLPMRQMICNLGAQGWAIAFAGVAALSWSDPLIPESNDHYGNVRLSDIFLKTDTGALLDAGVYSIQKSLCSISEIPYTDPSGLNWCLGCAIMKDTSVQQIEYSTTLGFDRAADSKPFYLY